MKRLNQQSNGHTENKCERILNDSRDGISETLNIFAKGSDYSDLLSALVV